MKPLRVTRQKISRDIAEKAIARASEYILARIQPLQLYVFGSAVTQEFSDQSDLDFLIVCKDPQNIKELQKKLGRLQLKSDFPIELVWTTAAEFDRKKNMGGVCMEAHQYGRLIYGHNNDS